MRERLTTARIMMNVKDTKMKRDALYWRYFYKYQSLLARDVNYLDQIQSTNAGEGNGVRAESSLPFQLIEDCHDIALQETYRPAFIEGLLGQEAYQRWGTLRNHPWIVEIREREENKLSEEKCTKELYHFTLKSLDEKLRVFIDDEVEADNYYLVIRKKKVVGGFATTKRGYLTGVFALERGLGTDLYNLRMKIARQDIDESVKQYRIFCTGDFLLEFYKKQGFEVTDVVAWDDAYAPKGWDYEANGRPNLYNLERERRY